MKTVHILNFLQIFAYSGFAFLVAVILFPKFIEFLKEYKLTQKIREDGLSGGAAKLFNALHKHKSGTPTMGGVVIIAAILATVVLSRVLSYYGVVESSLLNRGETYLPIATLAAVGFLGMVDDYLNITESSKQKGLSAKVKFWTLFLFALLGGLWFTFKLGYSSIHVPLLGDFEIGLWYFPLFIFIIVGTSNAVNITDGLDGLSGGLLSIAFSVFGVIAYFNDMPVLAGFCIVVLAALIGFLWFNVPPAKVYMGDTGSLALGATLGVIAMMTDSMFILALVGLVFVLETLSVVLQLFWKKYFKKKLFKIAPIHHHFEAIKWSETQVVMRFWIIGAVCGILGLLLAIIDMFLIG